MPLLFVNTSGVYLSDKYLFWEQMPMHNLFSNEKIRDTLDVYRRYFVICANQKHTNYKIV